MNLDGSFVYFLQNSVCFVMQDRRMFMTIKKAPQVISSHVADSLYTVV